MTCTIAECAVKKTPDDGQRNCPKHVEFYSKNKFEKLVHLVGFIIRVYHDARSPERQAVSKPVWHIPLLCVQWKNADDGQRNCPKHVEFYSKNKFEKLVHLVGFIITIYHDARSPNVRFSQFVCSGSPVLEGSGYTECKIVQLICNLFTFILYKLLPVGILNSCLSGTFVRSQRPAIRTLTFLVWLSQRNVALLSVSFSAVCKPLATLVFTLRRFFNTVMS